MGLANHPFREAARGGLLSRQDALTEPAQPWSRCVNVCASVRTGASYRCAGSAGASEALLHSVSVESDPNHSAQAVEALQLLAADPQLGVKASVCAGLGHVDGLDPLGLERVREAGRS